ncbi:MAG: carbohydrate kinase family protein [Verrucomicrobiales bacterium]
MKRSGILAAGNWIVDHVKLIDAFPDEDALAFIGEQSSANGGGPYNLLKDLAKLGAGFPLQAAGIAGDDTDGHWILEDCRANEIDTARLKLTDRAPTSYTDVMSVESTGRRTFFHQTGTNALLDDPDVELNDSSAEFFYLGYLLLLERLDRVDGNGTTGASRLLRRASAAGFHTVVDLVSVHMGNFREVVLPSLPETDTLFLNELEAGALLERCVKDDDAQGLLAAADAVLALGVRRRVVVHSACGAVVVSSEGDCAQHGSLRIPAQEIRGAAGAGDAFAAGVILGLHHKHSLEECLRFGVCSAAGCLTHPTTSEGVVDIKLSLAFGEKFGFRDFG